MDRLEAAIGQEDDWLTWLRGQLPADDGATAAAQRLAAENDSTVEGGAVPVTKGGYPGFQVAVRTNYTVGNSIIPGTETKHATAQAIAVVQPRCTFAADADPKKLVELDCDGGQTVDIDPTHFQSGDLPDASVLFSVHLAE